MTTPPTAATAPLRAPQAQPAAARRGNKRPEQRFVVPGETQWEVWAGSDAATSHLIASVPSPIETDSHRVSAVALPAREVITLPIWLSTTDHSIIHEMAALQCEKRAILNRARQESPFDYQIVAQENNESLLRVHILPATLSPKVCSPTAESFDIACRFTTLPGQALLLWRELGQLCVAITRRQQLVYAAPLGTETLDDGAIGQLLRLIFVAHSERWVSGALEIVLRGTFSAAEQNGVGSALSLHVRREARPNPWPPAKPSNLIPESVQQSLTQRRKTATLHKRIATAFGTYLAAILLWGGYIGWLAYQARALTAKVNATAPQVQTLRSTALRWNQLQPAINPSHYPVDILFHCANVLPKEGIQLTLFEQRGAKILLAGESRGNDSLGTVNTLLKDLKASKDLSEFTWNMPQPLIRDNACKFQIEGTRAPTHP